MAGRHGKDADHWWIGNPASDSGLTTSLWSVAQYSFLVPGRVFGFRMYRRNTDAQPHWLLFANNTTDKIIVAKQFFQDTAVGAQWKQCWIHPTFRITVNQIYNLFVLYPGGHWWSTADGSLVNPVTHGNIKCHLGTTVTGLNPLSAALGNSTNPQGIDVLFQPD